MNYNSLGLFLENYDPNKLLPSKLDFKPKSFFSNKEFDTIESVSWVTYAKNWQAMLKEVLQNFCNEGWGEGFTVQILFKTGESMIDELSVWVVKI